MNIVEDFKNPASMTKSVKLAYLLLFAAILWLSGAPLFLNHAKAAQLTQLSDTLYDSEPSVMSSSTLAFTNSANIVPGQSIKIQLDPATSLFTEAFASSTATTSLIYMTAGGSDYDLVNTVANCTAGNQVYAVGNYNGGSDENLTLTLCPAASVIGTTTSIVVGISPGLFTNPSSVASYVVRVSSTGPSPYFNLGDARVAIINDVLVTASVDTTLTFTISGMGTTTTVNGTSTTVGSTATLIPFSAAGALTPNHPQVASQQLNVTTNASNGFTVTVHAGDPGSPNGGDLTSSGGDDIDFFKDGQRTSSPSAWTAPANTLNQENTYGHFGLTTSDSDGLAGLTAFGANNWVGNFYSSTTRAVLANNGPSDGVADNIGSTTVGYAIQIGSLQQAGTDYQTTLTYVATPIF